MRRLALPAYSLLLRLLQPAYLAKLWWRGRAEPAYREAIGERFGRYRDAAPAPRTLLWLHAVSLGETRAAAALVEALRRERPGLRLLLTHGTATGRAAGSALLRPAGPGHAGDLQAWLPVDTPEAVARFLAHFKPALGVLMETEIWPNLLRGAERAGVPMVLANARLSAKSDARGARLDALLRPAAASFALVLAQTEEDAERMRRRGARQVEVCGNLKFDMTPAPALVAAGEAWRSAARAAGRPLVLAASTREGEEEPLLRAWRAALALHEVASGAAGSPAAGAAPALRPRLLLVPRHPQRFDEVAAIVGQQGLRLARRSAWGPPAADGAVLPDAAAAAADVWLGDSLGEMPLYYAAAEVALLGGSFAPLGGQNLIEAAACGCPVVMGPHTFNFDEAATLALAAGAAERVPDVEAGVQAALALLEPGAREAASRRALDFARRHRGAAARMAGRIVDCLQARPGLGDQR